MTEKNKGGKMINAEGKSGMKDVWGKRSNWVDYSGVIEGEKLGVAIFDHPGNGNGVTHVDTAVSAPAVIVHAAAEPALTGLKETGSEELMPLRGTAARIAADFIGPLLPAGIATTIRSWRTCNGRPRAAKARSSALSFHDAPFIPHSLRLSYMP